ncbi:MFS transporter, partial [Priestia megaterium]
MSGIQQSIFVLHTKEENHEETTTLAGKVQAQATVQGINDAFYWTVIIAIIGLILSFFLRDVRK